MSLSLIRTTRSLIAHRSQRRQDGYFAVVSLLGTQVIRSVRLLLVSVFFVGGFGFAHADDVQPIYTVPTEMCRGYFFVPVTLSPKEGYAEDRTLWFIYDTGAGGSFVDPESIERVTGMRLKSGQSVSIKDASAGPVSINKLPAKTTDLDHLSLALGREIDGILAFNAFADFLLTLDYQNEQIRLQKGKLPRPDNKTVFDASGPDNRPWLVVRFSHRKRRMLIDSGAGLSDLVVRKLEKFDTQLEPRVSGISFRLKETRVRNSARASENAFIGGYELVTPTLQSTEGTELIGGKVLRNFILTFDQDRERVKLVQFEPETPITFDSVKDHGLILSPHKAGFVITGTLDDTPASRSEVQKGDVITHWNGEPVARRSCESDPADVLSLVLGIDRGGQALTVELELFNLVD